MPDVLEMPYTPPLSEGSIIEIPEKEFDYRLGGNTCLAGDIIGNYRFDHDVQIGERLTFCDMAIYSMVKIIHLTGYRFHPYIQWIETGIAV